jgi:CubicO group peptidase (beta-lactamase class C family)
MPGDPVDPRVAEALEHALSLGEVGVQVAACLRGRRIVDAWAGVADLATGRMVDGATLFSVFSVTKAVSVSSLHLQD